MSAVSARAASDNSAALQATGCHGMSFAPGVAWIRGSPAQNRRQTVAPSVSGANHARPRRV